MLTDYEYQKVKSLSVIHRSAMKFVLVVFCAVLASFVPQSDGARILALLPFEGRSHFFVVSALAKELARRGHQVTAVSSYPQTPPLANYTDVPVQTNMWQIFGRGMGSTNMFEMRNQMGPISVSSMMWGLNSILCDSQLQEEAVTKLIESTEHEFDVIIMEAFFNECFLGFVHKFKAPLIQICTFGGTPWMADWVGNPNPYAYVPDAFLNYGDRMSLWERIYNTIVGTYWRLGREYYYLPKQDAVMRKHFSKFKDLPSISEIEHRTSLMLVNSHFSLNYPKPLMPNLVQVGGLHVKPPKELPKDLKKYLDEAKDGVVYFSMGSNLKSAELPEEKKKAFLEAFSKLKQKVLWKWEEDTLPGKPSNVKVEKWLPQSDILAHPNVQVFMTHGGLLSTEEAIDRGIPVVGIPIFGDQELNMGRAEASGFGIKLNFDNITTEAVSWALNEVISNPKYRENAKRISEIYKDQPLTPLQQAVYWTEYIIRHKGAPHLRSAVLDLAWYQYFLLDVIAVLVLAAGSFVWVVKFVLCKLFGKKRDYSVPKSRKID